MTHCSPEILRAEIDYGRERRRIVYFDRDGAPCDRICPGGFLEFHETTVGALYGPVSILNHPAVIRAVRSAE